MTRQSNLRIHSEMSKTHKSQRERERNSCICCYLEQKLRLSAQTLNDWEKKYEKIYGEIYSK